MHPDAYTVSLPYPEARPCREDPRLARQLFPMYTGSAGEMASISSYLYAALRTENCQPELSRIFDDLARTEMHHFRLLGRLLRDLGADPYIRARIDSSRIAADQPAACALTGTRALRSLFAQSLHAEQSAADNYRYLMTQTGDEGVHNLLHRILLDEEQHARLFENLLK